MPYFFIIYDTIWTKSQLWPKNVCNEIFQSFYCFVSSLRLSFNSTRRARFDTKLGFFPKITLPTSFDKLESNGGIASELTVYIAKKYPVVYNDVKNPGKGALSQKMADALEMNQQREQDLEQVRVNKQGILSVSVDIIFGHFEFFVKICKKDQKYAFCDKNTLSDTVSPKWL